MCKELKEVCKMLEIAPSDLLPDSIEKDEDVYEEIEEERKTKLSLVHESLIDYFKW